MPHAGSVAQRLLLRKQHTKNGSSPALHFQRSQVSLAGDGASTAYDGVPRCTSSLVLRFFNRVERFIIMSSMHRTITGDILVQHLDRDAMMIDPGLVAQHRRSARTLVKEGPLRLTIMALAPGGDLPAHISDDPVSIHVLHGDVRFFALDHDYALSTGDVLVFAAGVEHAARSRHGAVFLLTVVHCAAAGVATGDTLRSAARHVLSEAAKQRWMDDGGHQEGVTPPADTPS